MKKGYFKWLCDQINDEEDVISSHKKLLKALYETEFVFGNPSNGNRAGDGLGMRKAYGVAGGKEMIEDHLDGFPSVLEMLVAFAIRIETEYLASRKDGNQTSKWFWEMLYNANLSQLTDGKWDEKDFNRYVTDVMVGVNNASFFKNKDGRKYVGTENLWQEMMAWVNDKMFERGIFG